MAETMAARFPRLAAGNLDLDEFRTWLAEQPETAAHDPTLPCGCWLAHFLQTVHREGGVSFRHYWTPHRWSKDCEPWAEQFQLVQCAAADGLLDRRIPQPMAVEILERAASDGDNG